MNLPNLTSNAGAMGAVILGAVLAMVSGVLGNQYETWAVRRDRERSAALLFGEVLSTVRILLDGAKTSTERGEPFGPFTRRLLTAARREMNIYERNRESLMALREAQLRSDLHNLALRIAMPLDSLVDSFLVADMADEDRMRVFGFLMENAERIPGLTARLGRIAKHNFEEYGEVIMTRPADPSPS